MTQYWAEFAWRLTDYAVLPMKVTDYGDAIEKYTNAFIENYGTKMQEHGLNQGLGK